MTRGEGLVPTSPPEGAFEQQVNDAMRGRLGRANLDRGGVQFPAIASVVGRADAPSGLEGTIDCQLVEFELEIRASGGVGLVDVEVQHGLGRVPTGFWLIAKSSQGVQVDGWPEGAVIAGGFVGNETPWTSKAIYVRGFDAARFPAPFTARVRLLVF